MYFNLPSFITYPMLTASFLICVTTSSVVLTSCPSINTSSAYAVYCLVLLKIVPFGLVSVFTLSDTVLNSAVNSASPCLKPLSMPDASVNCPWICTFPLETCNVIFIQFTGFFGIPNFFKISYKYVLFIES